MMANLNSSSLLWLVVGLVGAWQWTAAAAADQTDQLKAICADDKHAEVARATELRLLVEALPSVPESICSERIRAAFTELDQLINSGDDNICAPSTIDQIRSFYTKYVDKRSISEQNERKLPKALKALFLSYGFGVSKTCKSNLIALLTTDSKQLLTEADFQHMDVWTDAESRLSKMLMSPKDVDDVVLPVDMISVVANEFVKGNENDVMADYEADEKVAFVLSPTADRAIRKIQAACARRFRPIYRQLILPLVSLSRVGLNYKGEGLEELNEAMKSNQQVRQWYRIVFVCESLAQVELMVDPETSVAVAGETNNMVRVLSEEEADELRAKQPAVMIDDGNIGPMIEYQPGLKLKLDDLIVDKADKRMRKLVEKFEANKSQLDRIRSKVLRQLFSITKDTFLRGKLNIVKALLKSKGSYIVYNDELTKLADRYISSEVEYQEEPVDGTLSTGVTTTDGTAPVRRRRPKKPKSKLMKALPFIIAVVYVVGAILGSLAFFHVIG